MAERSEQFAPLAIAQARTDRADIAQATMGVRHSQQK
jgi:hypothetical protein